MPMKKLNSSAMKCFHPDCYQLPTVQLDSKKYKDGDPLYTAAQALVCPEHVNYGKEYLMNNFPGNRIIEIKNPGWLSKEQNNSPKQVETPTQQLVSTTEQKRPLTKDELRSYIENWGAANRRRK